ncbi:Hypothetical predicted protein [Paramuricea clavata]|uniref:Uncharacterized protein n=1 Tax=Paramuricea clavata TaxID=317549 RepID=A0A6S7HPV0_PARCT|nr:Hypothetical predicted protein [Paramuricea clavata]
MDENYNMEKCAGVSDEDIIHLLNTKKQKSREILSITNAAADSVSNRAQTQAKQAFGEHLYSSQNYAENKENNMSAHISDSFVSTGSRVGSFSGQQQVRIPSRLLREIKSPLDRSSSGNVSCSESKDTSSGSLFASQSSSGQSSIQATGPVPTVIKYSTQPSEQSQPNPPHGSKNRLNDTPVVIKYLQEYTSPNSTDSTINSKPITSQAEPKSKDFSINRSKSVESQVEADNNSAAMPVTISQKSPKTSFERHSLNKPEVVVSGSKNVEQLRASYGSKRPEKKDLAQSTGKHLKTKGAGLCQGAPSNNLSYVAESERGQVKAVSFNTSDKGRATRDMLAKRQDHGLAVRRVVQPKIIEEKPVRGDQRLSQENPSKESSDDKTMTNETVVQFPSGFEERMKNLMSTLGAIESQCQENRVWQEKQQQELEQSIKQRDERRLQHLEEMQKQLVEYQFKYAQPITAPPQHIYTSTVGSTTQGLSTTQVNHAPPTQQALPHPTLQTSSSRVASQNLTQGVSASNPNYTAAVQHQTQPSFKTTVYSKPREENPKSGVKRKFVRNTRTQTSPQVSSSETSSSPLDTPLPRKRHPVPMTRDWKTDRGKKHVHFDTPDDKNIGKPLKKRVDVYPVVRSVEVDDQKMNGARILQSSQQYGR